MFNLLKNIGPTELVLIAVIIFLIFGSRTLVKFSRKLGTGSKELSKVKRELDSVKSDLAEAIGGGN